MISEAQNAGPSAMQVVDLGTTRKDLASRREIKYALLRTDVAKLERLLETNCTRLIHNEPVSVVRSIYFDDLRLSACHANLSGVGVRRKLRIRWYDDLRPGRDFFLEVKWRDNRVTGKHRLQMRSEQPLDEIDYVEMRRQLEPVLPEHLRRDFNKYIDPIVLVQYCRQHFATDDGIRLTLDYDLTYYDQVGRQRIATDFPKKLDGLLVIEGKTPVGRQAELRRWLFPLAPRATRCSKYVNGCCEIGLISEHQH